MRLWVLLLAAGAAMHFEVADGRGKKPSGVTVTCGEPDADGWCALAVTSKGKAEYRIVWPYDGLAKAPDGPEGVPVLVVEKGSAVASPRVATALLAGALLRGQAGGAQGAKGDDAFGEGVALLAEGKAADAVEPLGRALKERERQLTRVPSEIYPAAMLYGKALLGAGKFDDAAVAFLKAIRQRPGDAAARRARAEALVKAGKPEAAENVP